MNEKYFISFLSVILILTTIVAAVPANPEPFILTQPDGTSFQAKQVGDERQSHFETSDGYTIVQDSDGYWTYAVANDTELLSTQNKVGKANIKNLNFTKHLSLKNIGYEKTDDYILSSGLSYSQTTIGTTKAIVILIGFTDVSSTSTHTPSYYNNLLFGTSSGANSLINYYKEVSYNQLNIVGAASSKWYTSSHTMSYYGADSSPGCDNANVRISKLAEEAISVADSDIDFSQYDGDGDGIVDHIIIIHAGNDQASSGVSTDIWSHKSNINMIVDGVRIQSYTMLAEGSPLGTFAHEFGHDIGLPDLYNTATGSGVVSDWDLMDGGGWNNGGNTPAHPSAWDKIQMGWITPITVTTSTTLNIPQIETTNSAYKISTSSMPSTEYFLVENRQKTGYDSYLPDDGIVIWHIDEAQGSFVYNDINNGVIKHVAVEDANNGLSSLLSGAAYSSDDLQTTFSPTTSPNSNSNAGISTGISIYNIGSSSSSMSVSFSKSSLSALSISASQYNVSVGVPTNITFSVLPAINGVSITLSGAGVSISGITGSSGTVTFFMNPSNIGTITAIASKSGYVSGATTMKVIVANDYPTGADYLILGVQYSGLINPGGDEDWSYVLLNNTGNLTYDLSVPFPHDYDLEIYGPDSYTNLIGMSNNILWIDEKVTIIDAPPGRYYAKVYGYDDDYSGTAYYYIKTTFTPSKLDTTLPTISIATPTSGQILTTPTITVSGTASDNVALSKVEVKVGTGSWVSASGTTSWSTTVTLSSGSNTIYAKATDTSGNTQQTSVTVTYNPTGITPISSCTMISSPGSYVLTQSIINFTSSPCIYITSSNVVFDGAGYTIDGVDTSGYIGVFVYSSSTTLTNVTIKSLRVTDWNYGIYYGYAQNGSIINSTANSNIFGITLYSSSKNTLTSNTANSNNYGIYLYGSNNTLSNNTVNSNNYYGIYLNGSNNTLTNNTVNSNIYYGIYPSNSKTNIIYNNLFNNTNNFVFYGTNSNSWNTTKTLGNNIISGSHLGGNFWANPSGTGFSQTCADADSDGICDLPYTLATDNIDYIPLAYKSTTDIIPPFSVTNLHNITYSQTYINWTWTDSYDSDFSKVLIYLNGGFKTNVTKGVQYCNATGLIAGNTYTIATRTVDTSGNINTTWVNHTSITAPVPDTTAPSSITNLHNITYAQTFINWTWTDSFDSDFSKVLIYLNGSFKTNVTKGVLYYNATGLTAGSTHTIATRTVDIFGNVNQTWINHTATTLSLGGLRGDVNRNGIRDTGDGTLILSYIVELPIPAEYLPILPIGDMNCNGIIETGDATLILRDVAGLPISKCWE